MTPGLEAKAAEHALSRGVGGLARLYLSRPRRGGGGIRADVYYAQNRISFSQTYPYAHYAPEMRARHGAEFRFHPVEPFLDGARRPPSGADVILLQTWFTVGEQALRDLLEALRAANPGAVLGYLDSFAHSDLRLARHLDPHIDFYLKKSLFRSDSDYFTPFEGDTNLTQYYGRLHGIAQPRTDWAVPPAILPRLRLSPNFFTAPALLRRFAHGAPPEATDRPIDLHARLGVRGSPWYTAMRRAAVAKVEAMEDLQAPTQGGIDWRTYMAEMRRSKLCFSPFGYGEVCWRDVEAFLTGAVLVKPDMSHLETSPDLYVAHETYLPVRWDFSDLEEVVRAALADEGLRRRIAQTAFARIRDYLREARFVDDMAFLFAGRDGAAARPRAATGS